MVDLHLSFHRCGVIGWDSYVSSERFHIIEQKDFPRWCFFVQSLTTQSVDSENYERLPPKPWVSPTFDDFTNNPNRIPTFFFPLNLTIETRGTWNLKWWRVLHPTIITLQKGGISCWMGYAAAKLCRKLKSILHTDQFDTKRAFNVILATCQLSIGWDSDKSQLETTFRHSKWWTWHRSMALSSLYPCEIRLASSTKILCQNFWSFKQTLFAWLIACLQSGCHGASSSALVGSNMFTLSSTKASKCIS